MGQRAAGTDGAVTATPTDYYVGPHGNDRNAGIRDAPFATIARAQESAFAGTTIWIQARAVEIGGVTILAKSGTDADPIRIWADAGARSVLDFSSQPRGDSNFRGIEIRGDHWYLRGLEVENAADNGVLISGSHNVIEDVVVHDKRRHGSSNHGLRKRSHQADGSLPSLCTEEGCQRVAQRENRAMSRPMKRALLTVFVLALGACQTQTEEACPSGEQLCDDSCVPTSLVCCGYGNGAVCPAGYTCGTSASAPCLGISATVITINPPEASCSVMCRSGGCPVTFSPNPASVAVGDQVYWVSHDAEPHILMNESTGDTPITTVPANGMSGTLTFSQPGTYVYGAIDCEDPQFTGYLASGQLVVTVN